MRMMMKSKIHRATVTGANIAYEGSITLDPVLMEAADIVPYEQVHVLDINNGSRLVTYVIEGERGSGQVVINGAAARLVGEGDLSIIISYCDLSEDDVRSHEPRMIYVDRDNNIVRTVRGRVEAATEVAV